MSLAMLGFTRLIRGTRRALLVPPGKDVPLPVRSVDVFLHVNSYPCKQLGLDVFLHVNSYPCKQLGLACQAKSLSFPAHWPNVL